MTSYRREQIVVALSLAFGLALAVTFVGVLRLWWQRGDSNAVSPVDSQLVPASRPVPPSGVHEPGGGAASSTPTAEEMQLGVPAVAGETGRGHRATNLPNRQTGRGTQVGGDRLRSGRYAGLLRALRQVESAGDDRAVGDNGRSRGPYQCGRAAWVDACEYGEVPWDYDTLVFSRAHGAAVVLWYAARWGAKTDEEIARCWNSGPKWKSKYNLTDSYWAKVKKEMGK